MRKVVELPLAVYFDAVMSKRRIMEIYLNIAEWGPGIYGIEAAAQHHFGISAKQLSRRQAALLAVTLPNPIARNPAKPGPGLKRLANADRAARGPVRRLCRLCRLGASDIRIGSLSVAAPSQYAEQKIVAVLAKTAAGRV